MLDAKQFQAERAPKKPKRTQRANQKKMAIFSIPSLVARNDVHLEELRRLLGDSTSNGIGTALGSGVSGRGGLGCWLEGEGEERRLLACRDNVALLLSALTASEQQSVIAACGLDEDAFILAVHALPAGAECVS